MIAKLVVQKALVLSSSQIQVRRFSSLRVSPPLISPLLDSASSAVRNLNGHEIMGRTLRVDFSNDGGGDDDVSLALPTLSEFN
jgi:hypothetical protein